MPWTGETGGYHFVGSALAWYNLSVRGLLIGYFFLAAVLAALPVLAAFRLRDQFRQPWLSPYVAYLAAWGAVVLLSVGQYMLLGTFLPESAWDQTSAATRPLFFIAFGVAMYFLGSFLSRLTGGGLSRGYTVAFVTTWGTAAVVISAGGAIYGDAPPPALGLAARLSVVVLKFGLTYGWILYALLAIRRMDDPLDRIGLRRFVLLQGAGFLAFDLAVRDVTRLIGLPVSDVAISLVQAGANYPALLWMRRFLARRALARPAEPRPADLKPQLVSLGLSAREADVVELLLSGLSHKEIGERLFIAPETVKKHTYNAHRKLGVQNRVQLSYFVQNRLARRD
jgi:DNA-binding CsgD family transcriptional regulator